MDLTLLTHPALLVVNALTVFRLARFVTRDAFPLGVARLRFVDWANERWEPLQRVLGPLAGVQRGDSTKVNAYDGTAPLAYLATCPWCVSMYLAPAVAVLAATGTWWLWISIPLAFSAVAGVLASITD